jgi:archaellum component FlaD/FlaE
VSSRKERAAQKRRKMAKATYRDHLLDLFFIEDVDGNDLPGIRTADIRRKIKRQTRVRS